MWLLALTVCVIVGAALTRKLGHDEVRLVMRHVAQSKYRRLAHMAVRVAYLLKEYWQALNQDGIRANWLLHHSIPHCGDNQPPHAGRLA